MCVYAFMIAYGCDLMLIHSLTMLPFMPVVSFICQVYVSVVNPCHEVNSKYKSSFTLCKFARGCLTGLSLLSQLVYLAVFLILSTPSFPLTQPSSFSIFPSWYKHPRNFQTGAFQCCIIYIKIEKEQNVKVSLSICMRFARWFICLLPIEQISLLNSVHFNSTANKRNLTWLTKSLLSSMVSLLYFFSLSLSLSLSLTVWIKTLEFGLK